MNIDSTSFQHVSKRLKGGGEGGRANGFQHRYSTKSNDVEANDEAVCPIDFITFRRTAS